MNPEPEERSLTTADIAAAAEMPSAQHELNQDIKEPVSENQNSDVRSEDAQLAPLFLPDVAKDFRSRWDVVQRRAFSKTKCNTGLMNSIRRML